ncbi:hypothetical protein SAMN05216370_0211 [Pseudomonas peli]|uniref:Uncharacterized protein n=1 Tax=Pseudomonas peli TaxID=592361 RepID=A0AB37Z2D9_9PSED|nr:hypothetical protein SAMN05216370_0211 [Pseudomonas peli]
MKLETIQALADRCGVAYEIAHNWAMRGAIPTIKLGKRRMVIIDDGQLPPPPTCTGLRLLCLLVKGRNGQARSLPVHTLRPMPPRVCPTRAHAQNAPRRWCLDALAFPMGNHTGLYLRQTHAKRPTAQVLERCGQYRQARAFRAASRTFRAGGVSHV